MPCSAHIAFAHQIAKPHYDPISALLVALLQLGAHLGDLISQFCHFFVDEITGLVDQAVDSTVNFCFHVGFVKRARADMVGAGISICREQTPAAAIYVSRMPSYTSEAIVDAHPHQVKCRVTETGFQETGSIKEHDGRTGKGVASEVHLQILEFQSDMAGKLIFGTGSHGPSRRGTGMRASKAGRSAINSTASVFKAKVACRVRYASGKKMHKHRPRSPVLAFRLRSR